MQEINTNTNEELANTIYVGGIPEDITIEDLQKLFITFGEIKSVDLPIDSETQKNRGFAFIEYEDTEDAESAIDNYDEGELFGRIVKVKPAKPYKPKSFYTKPVWHSEEWQRRNNEDYSWREKVRKEKQKKREDMEKKKEEEKKKKYSNKK